MNVLIMVLLAQMFPLCHRMKSGKLVKIFVTVQNNISCHHIASLDFTENLGLGRNIKDYMVQIMYTPVCKCKNDTC
jgi:hypothetical protein